jgi:hypothetical protein
MISNLPFVFESTTSPLTDDNKDVDVGTDFGIFDAGNGAVW